MASTTEQRRGRGRHHSPKGDPLAVLTWGRVAEEFNRRHGTSLTLQRVQQIGRAAMAKARQAREAR